MVDRPIGDNAQDFGTTTQLTGTVGITAVQVPATAGNPIATALIRCPEQSPVTKRLSWSIDDITYHTLGPGEFIAWSLKGNITQLYLKGSVAGVNYEVVLNREPT